MSILIVYTYSLNVGIRDLLRLNGIGFLSQYWVSNLTDVLVGRFGCWWLPEVLVPFRDLAEACHAALTAKLWKGA